MLINNRFAINSTTFSKYKISNIHEENDFIVGGMDVLQDPSIFVVRSRENSHFILYFLFLPSGLIVIVIFFFLTNVLL